jgi:hypothetical protein
MFVVRAEGGSKDAPVFMWLKSLKPLRWGDRKDALTFRTKGDAARAASAIKLVVRWSIEPA